MKFATELSDRFKKLQDGISSRLETLDGKGAFREDTWEREGGGGGRTRALEDGALIEKAGVNFSAVQGKVTDQLAGELDTRTGQEFFATGVSLIVHHRSPRIPIFHMNVRYFELSTGRNWFGGGIDLTPIYVDPPEAGRFHRRLKRVCDEHDPAFYPRFKEWADEYFYLPHREETRGVGGIFFDRLEADEEHTSHDLRNFVEAVGDAFLPCYEEVVLPKKEENWEERELEWQNQRRSRYVEFNLLHDRGTRFGISSNGRTESILISMPPRAEWHYRYEPEEGTPEAETQNWLRKGIDWKAY
jgi:coproporphyrinogen III oxidase